MLLRSSCSFSPSALPLLALRAGVLLLLLAGRVEPTWASDPIVDFTSLKVTVASVDAVGGIDNGVGNGGVGKVVPPEGRRLVVVTLHGTAPAASQIGFSLDAFVVTWMGGTKDAGVATAQGVWFGQDPWLIGVGPWATLGPISGSFAMKLLFAVPVGVTEVHLVYPTAFPGSVSIPAPVDPMPGARAASARFLPLDLSGPVAQNASREEVDRVLAQQLRAEMQALKELESATSAVTSPIDKAEALALLAEGREDMASDLRKSFVPPYLDPELATRYRLAIEEKALPIIESAHDAWVDADAQLHQAGVATGPVADRIRSGVARTGATVEP